MSCHQDSSARSLIYTTGFHTNNTVFYDINDTDTVLAAKTVELCDDLGNFHCFAVESLRNTFLKCHGYFCFFIWCFFRSYT